MCGRAIGELLCDGKPARGLLRIPCYLCRDVVHEFYYHRAVPRGRLLVIQTIDLATAAVLPEEAAVFLNSVPGDRSESRGGERLAADVLIEALRLRRELHGR